MLRQGARWESNERRSVKSACTSAAIEELCRNKKLYVAIKFSKFFVATENSLSPESLPSLVSRQDLYVAIGPGARAAEARGHRPPSARDKVRCLSQGKGDSRPRDHLVLDHGRHRGHHHLGDRVRDRNLVYAPRARPRVPHGRTIHVIGLCVTPQNPGVR